MDDSGVHMCESRAEQMLAVHQQKMGRVGSAMTSHWFKVWQGDGLKLAQPPCKWSLAREDLLGLASRLFKAQKAIPHCV